MAGVEGGGRGRVNRLVGEFVTKLVGDQWVVSGWVGMLSMDGLVGG